MLLVAFSASQIIQLSPSDFTCSDFFNSIYLRRMQGEYPFHAYTVRDPAYSDRLGPHHGPHPDVAEDLVLWRRAKARELNVPPYFILHQKVLHAIADLKPSTREELTMVPGFGEKMFDKYGKDILEITTL